MTSPPQDRDGPTAVAALAVRVDGLRRRIETLATKVDAFTSTQQAHATALDGIAELRQQVEQILALLNAEDEASPAEWFWLTMTDQKRDERFSELSDWVETVLQTQYPTTSPTRSGPAGQTTPKPDGSWPGSTSSGPTHT